MQDPELVITAQEGVQVIGSAVHLGTTSSLKTDRNLMEMPLSLTRVTPGFLCLRPGMTLSLLICINHKTLICILLPLTFLGFVWGP